MQGFKRSFSSFFFESGNSLSGGHDHRTPVVRGQCAGHCPCSPGPVAVQ